MSKRKAVSEDAFIRIEIVAQKLGVSIETIKNLIIDGKLLALKLENALLISQMSLEELIVRAAQQALNDLKVEINEENQNVEGIKSEEIVSIFKEFVPKNCNVTLKSIQNIVHEQGISRKLLNEKDIQIEPGTSNVHYKHLVNSVIQRLIKPGNKYGLKVARVGRGLYEFK